MSSVGLLDFLHEMERWSVFVRKPELTSRLFELLQRIKCSNKEGDANIEDLSAEIKTFFRDVWAHRDYTEIDKCRIFVDSISNEIDISTELTNLYCTFDQLQEEKDSKREMYLYAKGFADLLFYREAFTIAIDLVLLGLSNQELELEIRRALSYWYSDCPIIDDDFWNFLSENEYTLLVISDNVKEQKNLFSGLCINFHRNFQKIIRFLKNNNNYDWWDYICTKRLCSDDEIVDLYEQVNPLYKLPLELYEGLFNVYNSRNVKDKVCHIQAETMKYYPEQYKLLDFELKVLVQNNQWDEVLAKLNEEDNIDSHFLYKGVALHHTSKFSDAISSLEKCEEKYNRQRAFYWIVLSYIAMGDADSAIQYCIDNRSNEKWFSEYLFSWINNGKINERFLVDLLCKLEALLPIYVYYDPMQDILNYILHITSPIGEAERGRIRYDLLCISNITTKILNNCLWKREPHEKIYHYSKPISIKYLPQFSSSVGGSLFRLGNVSFLNDPEEGKIFDQIANINNDLEEGDIRYKQVYLGCFSLAQESLPMWVQYAENGKGLCYGPMSRFRSK